MAKSTSKLFTDEQTLEGNMNLPEEDVQKEEIVEKKSIKKKDKKELPETVVPETPNTDEIQDIEMAEIKKTPFRINGDNDRIIHLNLADLSIANRMTVAYTNLNNLMDEVAEKFANLPDYDGENLSDEQFEKVTEVFDELDRKMGEQLNYLFNSDEIYEVFKKDGSMWDPINGYFRYEYIIDKLANLYGNNINSEINRIRQRISRKTQKYTNIKPIRR